VKIGVISDTHGYLDPRVERIFEGVDHILHAGDIGYASIILELELIAPVTAVLGNCDENIGYPLFQSIALEQKKFLVHHIVSPRELSDPVKTRIAKDRPDVVIFGHTHKAFAEIKKNILFFNPGYAGKPKFGAERSVALLHVEDGQIRHEFIAL
jgi:putative phosphoesterase